MTLQRNLLLNRVAQEQGRESLLYSAVIKVSDMHPESEYDDILTDTYNTIAEVRAGFYKYNDCDEEFE
jgi:hypothetical protein